MTDFRQLNTGRSTTASYAGTTTERRWDDYADTYRSDWESRYGQNRRWSEYEPAYRYGWESAQEDRFRGREFSEAEPDLSSGWSDYRRRFDEARRGEHKGHSMEAHETVGGKMEHAWENFKDTVREGWDRARMEFEKRT